MLKSMFKCDLSQLSHVLRSDLSQLYYSHGEAFDVLFRKGGSLSYSHNLMKNLSYVGIIDLTDSEAVRSKFRIFHYSDHFFLTDFPTSDDLQVFTPYDEEVELCAPFYTSGIHGKADVLEIGTGCGLYSILAGKRGASVLAIDINRRAIEMARINKAINARKEKVIFKCEDFRNYHENSRFDFVIASLPYMPSLPDMPGEKRYSYGGILGNDLSQRALDWAIPYLKPWGKLRMYTMSLGSQDTSIIEKQAQDLFGHSTISIRIRKLYHTPTNFTKWYNAKFEGPSSQNQRVSYWLDDLERRKLNFMHYLTLEIERTHSPSLEIVVEGFDKSIPYPKSRYWQSLSKQNAAIEQES